MAKLKTKRIVVRVSEEEFLTVSTKADAAGVTVSDLFRRHLDQVRIVNRRDKEEWLRAVVAMKNAVASMTRGATLLNPSDSAIALAYLAAIHRKLDLLLQQFPEHAREILSSRNGQS